MEKGFAEFGQVTAASIQYVSGYVTKKMKDDNCDHVVKPFVRMSLKPGIGHQFLADHVDQIARDEGFYLRGKFYRIDSASLRFLIREELCPSRLLADVQLDNKELADLFANVYKKFTTKDKKDLDKELAMWYNIHNRLGDYLGRKRK